MAEAKAPEQLTNSDRTDLKEEDTPSSKGTPSLPPSKSEPDIEEEEESCGFCRFMKAGGCKEAFVNWMECVDSEKEKGNDFVESCMTQIKSLRECMLANEDYYRPMLEEEDGMYEDDGEPEAANV